MQVSLPRSVVIAAVITGLAMLTTVAQYMTPLIWTFSAPHGVVQRAVAVGGALVTSVLFTRLVWVGLRRRVSARHLVDLVIAGLVSYGLPAILGPAWAPTLLVFAGLPAAVLRGRPRRATVASAAVWAGTIGYGVLLGWNPTLNLIMAVLSPIIMVSMYMSVWLVHVVDELREARAELARTAVGDERVRFARDLHDLLGHTLQAVALRAELAGRLVRADPERAEEQVAEVQRIARDAVHDVREVVRGYRAISLGTELDGASAVLRAAGIRCASPGPLPELPGPVHETLGWTVREATTNVLRHSNATYCDLGFRLAGGRARLEIVNDGAGRLPGREGGNGLAGLAERVDAAGGTFTAAAADGGTFRVVADIPLAAPASRAGSGPPTAPGPPTTPAPPAASGQASGRAADRGAA